MPSETEYDAFRSLVERVLSVPHTEIQKRVEAHRIEAAKNPRKRGPKPKRRRRSSSRASAARHL